MIWSARNALLVWCIFMAQSLKPALPASKLLSVIPHYYTISLTSPLKEDLFVIVIALPKQKNEFYWQDFQWYLPIRSTTPQANMNALHDLKLAAIYSDKKTIFLQIYSYSRPWKPSASGISWTPLLDCRHQIKAVTSLKIWNNETKSLRSHLVGVTPPEGVFSRIILGLACNPAKWIENIQFLQN